jgi:hypothetical protein
VDREVESVADTAPAGPIEQLLGETEQPPAPTIVIADQDPAQTQAEVASGAIEAALQSSDQPDDTPPTVIVEGKTT